MNINSRTPLNVNVWFPNQIHIIFHSVFSGLEITLHKFVCWFKFFQHFCWLVFCPKKSFYFIPRALPKLMIWARENNLVPPRIMIELWISLPAKFDVWLKKWIIFYWMSSLCFVAFVCWFFLFNTSNSSRPFFASKLIMSVVILKQRLVSTARCINKRGCKSNVGATLPSKIPILAPKSKKETIDLITQNANETEVESRSAGKRGLNAFCVVVFHVLVLLASTLVINCRKHSQLSVFMWF